MTTQIHSHPAHHGLSTRLCVWVWVGLMLLTALTVWVSSVDFGMLHIVVALVVATVKAGLVVFWYMHILYESRAIQSMVFVAFCILAISIGFTFFDIAYR